LNALCEIAHAHGHRSTMVSGSVLFVKGANMMTKQNLSKIADVVLMLLFCLAAVFVTLSAVLGPPSLWILAR
jgi:hypothetical protein